MTIPFIPLDLPSPEVRLLELQPAEELESPLVVILKHHLIEDVRMKYHALSYVWGDQNKDRVQLHVKYEYPHTSCASMQTLFSSATTFVEPTPKDDHFVQGRTSLRQDEYFQTTIGKNLAAALRYLRSSSERMSIWADAICINQDDNEEKSHQVAAMYTIFASASLVTAWLGTPTEHTGLAIDTMNRLGKEFEQLSFHSVPELTDWTEEGAENEPKYCGITISQLPWVCDYFAKIWGLTDPRDSNRKPLRPFLGSLAKGFYDNVRLNPERIGFILEFYDIYERSYWERTWIIQECFTAQTLVFQCG